MTAAAARTSRDTHAAHDRLVTARRALGPWVGLSGLPALLAALAALLGRAPAPWVVATVSVWLVVAVTFAALDALTALTRPRQPVR